MHLTDSQLSQILAGREINLDMVQDPLKDLLKSSQKKVNIEEIQKKVSQHFNIKMSDMSSARRSRTWLGQDKLRCICQKT